MFKIFKIVNKRGETLNLCSVEKYITYNVTGLNPVQADLKQNESAFFDGVTIGAKRLTPRNIAIYLRLRNPIGENRARLYEFLQTKDEIEIFIQKEREEVTISGIVETFEADIFQAKCDAMISILCPDPYFYGTSKSQVDFVEDVGALEFGMKFETNIELSKTINATKADVYAGSSGGGFQLEAIFGATTHGLSIKNNSTNDYMHVGVNFDAGDKLKLSTIFGKKSAIVEHADGTKENIVASVYNFLELRSGRNEISIAENENAKKIEFTITHVKRYGGL